MSQKIINFLLYNETNELVQKNVQILAQITFLYFFYMAYYMFFAEKTALPTYDGAIVALIFAIWYGIRKHGVYYTRLLFIILVPLLNYSIVVGVYKHGLGGFVWSFPITLGLYFCFYKRTAILAAFITLVVSVFSSYNAMTPADFLRGSITLTMVTLCFTAIFLNFYHQYDLIKDRGRKDPLTNMLNRSGLKEILLTRIDQQTKNIPPILFYFDLDNFKYINDTFGHSIGDLALINFSKLLKKQVRNTDTVFRLGGEEFLIVVENMTLNEALAVAEKIRMLIEKSNLIENGHVVTSSIGIAVHQQDEEWDLWLNRADNAMYQAKQNGKNQVIVSD